ncbi:MAG: acyloxyacyl hydrolase [Campylobacteraceae bacterium]|nr:acyloxyacyl hydrolase [Campylobacteraceae bacterium]
MKLFILLLSLLILITNINAESKKEINDVSIAYGGSSEHIDIYKFSIKKDLNKYFFENRYDYLPKYYETSFSYWKGHNGGSIKVISFTPMFRYDFDQYYESIPYIEAGVGVAYLSKTQLEAEDFGTHFQFENVIGVGFKFDDYDLSFRYTHHSNAGLHENNSGVDFTMISISYRF